MCVCVCVCVCEIVQKVPDFTVQPHKMVRGLKFRIYEVEGLYYLCSENKGADQLRGYREADLRLCFRICKSRFSHDVAHLG